MKPPLQILSLICLTGLLYNCNKEKEVPSVNTIHVFEITANSAKSGGEIIEEGDAKVTAKGVCWSEEHIPTISDNKTAFEDDQTSFECAVLGLHQSTRYYLRAYATNRYGTGYGEALTFTTDYNGEIVFDIDSNQYHVVTIGNQTWMLENLKVTRFRNGDSIPFRQDSLEWKNNFFTAQMCNYINSQNGAVYGSIYSQVAVLDSRGLAPEGWHVPSEQEFLTLIDFLGGEDVAGGMLKEEGFSHWMSPNLGAGNESGFKALPAGRRIVYGSFEGMNTLCNFATSLEGRFLELFYNNSKTLLYSDSRAMGVSVRCIKD